MNQFSFLDWNPAKEFIDYMMSRAHRGVEKPGGNNDCHQQQGNKPIFVQFVYWCVAEEIK